MPKLTPKNTNGKQLEVVDAFAVSETNPSSPQLNEGEIAILAYRLWEERGCPLGCPETDWYSAEQKMQTQSLF